MIPPESLSISLSTFTLVALAEIGDKSQLVCMTLAARYRHWPVILGAATAFLILNTLAVLFGAGVAAWVPEQVYATGFYSINRENVYTFKLRPHVEISICTS